MTLAQGNAALAARNLQVARARVALLPDLSLGSGASSTLSAGSPANTGGSVLPQTPSTPSLGASATTSTSAGGSF